MAHRQQFGPANAVANQQVEVEPLRALVLTPLNGIIGILSVHLENEKEFTIKQFAHLSSSIEYIPALIQGWTARSDQVPMPNILNWPSVDNLEKLPQVRLYYYHVGVYNFIFQYFTCFEARRVALLAVFNAFLEFFRNIDLNAFNEWNIWGTHFEVAGRFGYGECLNIRDSVQPNKIEPGFVRILRHDFSSSKQLEDDLEKLIEIKHRSVGNLVRVLDFFILHSCSYNGSPLIFVRFDQIASATSLFDRLFDLQNVLPSRQYIKWAYQAAKGLNFLMDRGILHKRLIARSCLLDEMENLRLSDFWTENDPGDLNLFQRNLPNSISQRTIMFSDGWRYLPAETLINNQFDCTSQVWTFGLLVWQIYTHHQFGNRIIAGRLLLCLSPRINKTLILPQIFFSYSTVEEFLSLTSGRDDPYFMPGHLNKKEAQQGMPEQRRRKAVFLKASEQLPHPPESLAKIIPSALLPDRSERPYFSEIFRILESEKRILDLAHVIGRFF
uniref:Protein kinase domain-containing protein n=2 Tax=Meloidogyne hapla TaxID=6305 RepID=A0A1I8C0X0_MELHA